MFGWLRFIYLVRQIDGLCFEKRTWIIPKLFGRPSYSGDPPRRAFFVAPIFFRYGRVGPLQIAIHEVRHKIQWHYPEIKLLTPEDVPDIKLCFVDNKEKLSVKEIDAKIVEQKGALLFSSKQTSAFLELMLGKAKLLKES